ncbi:MAG: YitT family protein, partial [Oscillospiraceae bacterium]
FGIYNVHSQNDITEGGILGLTLLLEYWFDISPGTSSFILDSLCFLVGFKFLGKDFVKYSFVASLSFAGIYSILERFPPLLPSMLDYPVLAAIVGGCFVGTGVGIAMRIGGACGGDDALAMTVSYVTGMKVTAAYLFLDIVVLFMSLSYIPASKIIYSLITVTVSSFIIGRIKTDDPVTSS